MRKTILTFGFISGAILSAMMAATLPFMDHGSSSLVVGYTTMVVAFLFVFFGIRSYRENVAGGAISFGQAFRVGISITAIACCCYVATWEVIYYKFVPDFGEKYAAVQLERAKAAGASEAALEKKRKEMEEFQKMYKNPLANIALTFLEPLPPGILMTLLAAGLLRRRPASGVVASPS